MGSRYGSALYGCGAAGSVLGAMGVETGGGVADGVDGVGNNVAGGGIVGTAGAVETVFCERIMSAGCCTTVTDGGGVGVAGVASVLVRGAVCTSLRDARIDKNSCSFISLAKLSAFIFSIWRESAKLSTNSSGLDSPVMTSAVSPSRIPSWSIWSWYFSPSCFSRLSMFSPYTRLFMSAGSESNFFLISSGVYVFSSIPNYVRLISNEFSGWLIGVRLYFISVSLKLAQALYCAA